MVSLSVAKNRGLEAALLVICCIAIGSAQAPEQAPAPAALPAPAAASKPAAPASSAEQPLTFTARSNLVLVPVVVTDGAGNHIVGLKKEQFSLHDSGKPVEIAVFDEVKSSPERVQREAPRKDVFTNMLAGAEGPRRLTIIALDLINTPFADQAYARQQILKYLSVKVESNEPTALITIGRNGTKVIHDFTTDTKVLIAALQKVSGQPTMQEADDPAVSNEIGRIDELGNDVVAHLENLDTQTAIMDTLEAFQHVAEGFAGVPGRKSLIWVTAGFPFYLDPGAGTMSSGAVLSRGQTAPIVGGTGMDASGNLPQLPSSTPLTAGLDLRYLAPVWERTYQMLANANVAIYPIDARGLMTFFPGADVSRISGFQQELTRARFESSRDAMNTIAESTGGRAFYNTNDLTRAVERATDDSSDYYMLGYYLPKDAKNGWHRLQVKVSEKATVHARSGFFVLRPSGKPDDTRRNDVAMALASPIDYTAVPLVVRLGEPTGAGPKKSVPFLLVLAPQGLALDPNQPRLDLDVIAVARTGKGENADAISQKVAADLKPDKVAELTKGGVRYTNSLQVAPGDYTAHFVVRDNLTGRIGSISAPFTVR